jgi:predicted GTPase
MLAGPNYPKGIPIYPESDLETLILEHDVHQVVFSYSDVSHEYVMHAASRVLACGPDFCLLGPDATSLKSEKPVVSVCAARTGSGKSQTSRKVAQILRESGYTFVVVRHPMPYGDLTKQVAQRFANYEDLEIHEVTIEEREEYEPHLANGVTVFAGVDYQEILRQAEQEADVILWDGGNNDLPFFKSDLHIVVVDPHRPGHELSYHPGEANVRMADVIVINKIDTADRDDVLQVTANIQSLNPTATIIQAASPIYLESPNAVLGKKVLVVEDGPTLTHGDMPYGAGWITAKRFGAAEIVDPRPYAIGSIQETYEKYPRTGDVLPAMGYGAAQMQELEQTINQADADLVLVGTPIDLGRLIDINKPSQRLRYELQEIGQPTLADVLLERFPVK